MDQAVVRDGAKTATLRRVMVDNQIRTFDVTDQRLLERFLFVPRELFLPPTLANLAYSDAPLTVTSSTGAKRALLVPMVLARMLQGVAVQPASRVLVIGDGRGYTTALVAGLATSVVMVESDDGFVSDANAAFQALGIANASARSGPLPQGAVQGAPYDIIVVSGAVEANFDTLLGQLGPRGRLVTIEKTLFDGVRRSGKAVLFERFGGDVSARNLFDGTAPVLDGFAQAPAFSF